MMKHAMAMPAPVKASLKEIIKLGYGAIQPQGFKYPMWGRIRVAKTGEVGVWKAGECRLVVNRKQQKTAKVFKSALTRSQAIANTLTWLK